MEKDVLISLKGTQNLKGEDPQVIELVTQGKLWQQENAFFVSYQESEMTGLEGVVTTFEIERDKISLKREGALHSNMIFEEGKKNESLYDMGFGALLLGVTSKQVRSNLSEHGGVFHFTYDIEIEHVPMGCNSYHVEVHEPLQA